MPTLATLRAALRLDLNDPAGATARWSDSDLDRAITRAVAAYSEALPHVQSTTATTTSGSRVLPVTGLGAGVTVLSVEWPLPASGARGVAGRPPWRHDPEVGTVTVVGPEWRARAQAHLDRFDRDLKRLATARARSTRARVR